MVVGRHVRDPSTLRIWRTNVNASLGLTTLKMMLKRTSVARGSLLGNDV